MITIACRGLLGSRKQAKGQRSQKDHYPGNAAAVILTLVQASSIQGTGGMCVLVAGVAGIAGIREAEKQKAVHAHMQCSSSTCEYVVC